MHSTTADVRLLALSQGDFTRILGPLHELLERQATAYDTPTVKINKARGRARSCSGSPLVSPLLLRAPSFVCPRALISARLACPPFPPPLQQLKLEDLQHVACLGSGAFGKVTLVKASSAAVPLLAGWLEVGGRPARPNKCAPG